MNKKKLRELTNKIGARLDKIDVCFVLFVESNGHNAQIANYSTHGGLGQAIDKLQRNRSILIN